MATETAEDWDKNIHKQALAWELYLHFLMKGQKVAQPDALC